MFSAIRMTFLANEPGVAGTHQVSDHPAKALRPIRRPDSVSGINILPVGSLPAHARPARRPVTHQQGHGNRV